ncbi:hypothetical protein RHGRI_007213 [Rhododendron griersonianum]|uniref:Glycosyltransferase n=1 Tax=Rhododendron griersonianum TaxID=479676 RepID=A0AAV6KW19_9ERIC|nr:hypothetical protein RHGRI_007213 [Rhododendron griersonianum]
MAEKTAPHNQQQLHVFFFPFMSPGHQIPMLDMARLVATRGVKTTIVTTPCNFSRFQSIIDRDRQSGNVDINVHILKFPSDTAGLPQNCENLDSLPSRLLSNSFSRAVMMLQPQGDDLVRQYRPDAIISDLNIPWTAQIAKKYDIPRIVFHGTCCFSLCVTDSVSKYKPYEGVSNDWMPFLVPGLPDRVHITMSEMPGRFFRNLGLQEFFIQFVEAERNTYGVVANSVYEIEPEYVEHYKKISGKKIWTVGPVSLCNEKDVDMAERGNKASIDKDHCLAWLDSKEPNSVIYISFGSLCAFAESQLVEIGLGLEASNCSFIWVIKDGFGDGLAIQDLEERVKGRGLVIRGWAPQLLILNHLAVGGFMTHCGWNSVLEALSSGVPMITWPLFGEQFYNANFLLRQLKIGFGIGVDTGLKWGEEEQAGALVKRNRVAAVVSRLMGGSEMVKEMRERANRISKPARSAMSEGGSSYGNFDLLIKDLLALKKERLAKGE